MRAKDTLFEFYDENQPTPEKPETGYIDSAEDDELEGMKRDTTRRPRLTLRHLNKLRALRKFKRKEQISHLTDVARMYGNKPDDDGM